MVEQTKRARRLVHALGITVCGGLMMSGCQSMLTFSVKGTMCFTNEAGEVDVLLVMTIVFDAAIKKSWQITMRS